MYDVMYSLCYIFKWRGEKIIKIESSVSTPLKAFGLKRNFAHFFGTKTKVVRCFILSEIIKFS